MSCTFNHLGIMSSYWSESGKLLLSDPRVSLLWFLGNLKILQMRVGRQMVFSAWPSSWQAQFCTYGMGSPVLSWLGKSPCCSKLLEFWAATTLNPPSSVGLEFWAAAQADGQEGAALLSDSVTKLLSHCGPARAEAEGVVGQKIHWETTTKKNISSWC